MRRMGWAAVALLPVVLGAAMWGHPRVGGYTQLAAFDHEKTSENVGFSVDGIDFIATNATIYNRLSNNVAGAAVFVSARSTLKEPRCFRIRFRAKGDGQAEGNDNIWLIGKKQTLRYIGSANTVDVWRCHDAVCSTNIIDVAVLTWAPVAKGQCGAAPGG